ncbi:unnamed protein product [Zymoseptoria tritici ST99CH_1E4]|uniref:Uncharacterized protein n=1 Tax=Zymoseptoria tritici ST99CH_1E4 TaxID=1276532 RepID=A0A2H1GMR9_ZYMTR|nr:unnamed protein product [Zymoseptoria tritici ST99CH_1E4]
MKIYAFLALAVALGVNGLSINSRNPNDGGIAEDRGKGSSCGHRGHICGSCCPGLQCEDVGAPDGNTYCV